MIADPPTVTKEILPNGNRLYTLPKELWLDIVEREETRNEKETRQTDDKTKIRQEIGT